MVESGGLDSRGRFRGREMGSPRTVPAKRRQAPRGPSPGVARPHGNKEDSLLEVRFRSDPLEDEFSDLLRDPESGVRLIACRPSNRRSGDRLLRWLELETRSLAGRERVRQLTKRSRKGSVSVATAGTDRALVRLSSPIPGVCAAVFAAGAMCVSCPLLTTDYRDPTGSVRVLVPRDGAARQLRHELSQQLGGRIAMERAGLPRSSVGFTPRQEQAFRTALELGYFSYPRRADLAAVARRLGVSRSTTLELLRHAIRELGARRFPMGTSSQNRF
jgi:hypothetical protein